jgi:hypothetical protein
MLKNVKKKKAETQKALADARKAAAEADLAETNALAAKLELLKKLDQAGMVLCRDRRGNLTLLSKPNNLLPPHQPD